MNIDDAYDRAKTVQRLTARGAEIMASLRGYIEEEFKEHLMVSGESTPHRLYLNFYGLSLLIRIEVVWGDPATPATVSAYYLTDNRSKEIALNVKYQFDKLGNIKRTMTKDEFSAPFLGDVFNAIEANKILLQP